MPKRVDHAQRRQHIIEAVWRITARGGLHAATFREVAAEAGVSVRLVQYYFGTKADLLHAANRAVAERATLRLVERVRVLGDDAPPRAIVAAVVEAFIPTDEESREAMLLFFAFYTAQMTDPNLARGEASGVPRGLVALIAHQIRRAQETGDAPRGIDPELEASVIAAALPSVASSVLVGYMTPKDARRTMDYAIDRVLRQRATRLMRAGRRGRA